MQGSVTVFSYPIPLLCKSHTEQLTTLDSFVFYGPSLRGCFKRLERPPSHQRLGAQLRAPWPFHGIFLFCTGCVCALEGKLADFAQTQMQLMEVTVRLTVSDETAGC